MTRSRQALPLLALWVLVVAAASALAWAAISQAGREVTAGNSIRTVPAPTVAAASLAPATGTGLVASSSQPAPAVTPATQPDQDSAVVGSATRATSATGPATRPVPATRPTAQAPPVASATPVRTSLSVLGGSVGMSCRGSQPVLDWATPRNGWSFTVKREDGDLEVRFTASRGAGRGDEGDDESNHARSEVEGHCVNGRPVLRQK